MSDTINPANDFPDTTDPDILLPAIDEKIASIKELRDAMAKNGIEVDDVDEQLDGLKRMVEVVKRAQAIKAKRP